MNFMLCAKVRLGMLGAPSPALRHPGFDEDETDLLAIITRICFDLSSGCPRSLLFCRGASSLLGGGPRREDHDDKFCKLTNI